MGKPKPFSCFYHTNILKEEAKNGKKFSTGNHPVETLVPILHFEQSGFEVDFYTATGGSIKFEMWAMPYEDEHFTIIWKINK